MRSFQGFAGGFDVAQRNAVRRFRSFRENRVKFAPLPPKMFDIRGSKKWKMANYLLATEAAPRGQVADSSDRCIAVGRLACRRDGRQSETVVISGCGDQ